MTKNNLETICVQHLNKQPKTQIKVEGKGNCYECKPHIDNKYCKGYYPITITIYEVK